MVLKGAELASVQRVVSMCDDKTAIMMKEMLAETNGLKKKLNHSVRCRLHTYRARKIIQFGRTFLQSSY